MTLMSVKAVTKKIRVSPQKLNVVASMIRRMPVRHALDVLLYSKKRVAIDVRKTLLSAAANADNNFGLSSDDMYVKEAHVGHSLKLRRYRPRGRGRGEILSKPFSHLTIVIEEKA